MSSQSLGFVGVGTMNAAIIKGLCTLSDPPKRITISPRNAEKAQQLRDQFSGIVTIASDNQGVLDASDVVFVGVLPKQAEEVCRALRFKGSHVVISVVSTASRKQITEWCAPVEASSVIKAIPLPPVALHRGVTIVTPPHKTATDIFEALGKAVAVDTEEMLQTMMTVTCTMGQFYAMQRQVQRFLQANDVPGEAAAKYVGGIFHSISFDSADAKENTFEELVAEQTPGGLNEQVIRGLTDAGMYTALSDCMEDVLARIKGKDVPKKRKRPYGDEEEGTK